MKALVFAMTVLLAPISHAVSVGAAGGSGTTSFSIVGAPVTFSGTPTVDLTLVTARDVTFSMTDCCADGDEFALRLDGAATPWTTEVGVGTSALWAATYSTTLAAGSYSFGADMVASCCASGSGTWKLATFNPTSEVPLPAAAWMFLSGLGALGVLKRRGA